VRWPVTSHSRDVRVAIVGASFACRRPPHQAPGSVNCSPAVTDPRSADGLVGGDVRTRRGASRSETPQTAQHETYRPPALPDPTWFVREVSHHMAPFDSNKDEAQHSAVSVPPDRRAT
jgi:hypothetical protein